jgi:hypothetical protein
MQNIVSVVVLIKASSIAWLERERTDFRYSTASKYDCRFNTTNDSASSTSYYWSNR